MADALVDLRRRLWGDVEELPALEDMFPALVDSEADGETEPAPESGASPDVPEWPSGNGAGPAAGSHRDRDVGPAVPEDVPGTGFEGAESVDSVLAHVNELVATGDPEGASEALHAAFVRLEEARRIREALAVLARLLELRPDDATLHHQHTELALRANDRSLLLSAYAGLAACLRRTDAARQARAAYGRILDIDPSNAVARQAVAEIDAAEKEQERERRPRREEPAAPAVESSVTEEEAAEIDELLEGLEGLAEGDLEAGVVEEPTADEGDDAGDDDPAARSRYELGLAFRQMGMWEEAARELRPALNGIADRLRVVEALGECLLKAGRPEEAIDLLQSNLCADEDDAQVGPLYFLGLALQTEGRHAEAREMFGRVEAVRPGYRDAGERLSDLSP